MAHLLILKALTELRRLANDTPGMIKSMPVDTAPEGWIECDGRALDSTLAVNASLAVIIGPSAGNPHGDGSTGIGATGSTDFNLPDLRGRFIRGYNNTSITPEDDPDAAGRTGPVVGQASGNNVGSLQSDELELHSHSGVMVGSSPDSRNTGSGQFYTQGSAALAATGGNETRPNNITMMYVIRI